jgi:hypothetical protein
MQEIFVSLKEFKSIRQQNGVYIDKTEHIYNIFRQEGYFFLARPRRFGKSLLCTTLAELFAGNRELFKDLWIDQSNWQWEKHPVLYFDMTNASSKAGTAETVREGIFNMLRRNAEAFGITDLVGSTPCLMLGNLIEKAKKAYGKNTVVIIDEYDKPLLDVIDDPTRTKEVHQELSDFYSQLKPAEKNLRCVLITGVFKFTQTSIFSGLNNLNDITFDPKAAALVGYTEDEIRHFFTEHLAALATKNKLSVDAMMAKLQQQYNGYSFGIDIDADQLFGGIYNPYALNYIFAKQQQLDEWFASGSPAVLMKKLVAEQLHALTPQELNLDFKALKTSCSPNKLSSTMLLYYAGYMTMKACSTNRFTDPTETTITLDFPSSTVRKAFSDQLFPALMQDQQYEAKSIVTATKTLLRNRQLDELQQLLNDVLAHVSYDLLTRPHDKQARENIYQIIFVILFSACGMRVTAEEQTNRGRMDIMVELHDLAYIMELKMDQPAGVAIDQIQKKEYGAKFRHLGTELYVVGISISATQRRVQEVAWKAMG